MQANVNFCTTCGTDIRNVPVNGAQNTNQKVEVPNNVVQPSNQNAKPTQPNQQIQNTQPIQQSQPTMDQPQQPTQSRSQYEQSTKRFVNQMSQQVTSSVKSFNANNLWQWFVNSWKHPTAEQNAEKWYGWVTILVENLLIIIGMTVAAKNAVSSSGIGRMIDDSGVGNQLQSGANGGVFELFLFLILNIFATIFISYLAHKFIYKTKIPMTKYINKVVQIGNLSAIFDVLAFVFLIVGQYTFGSILIICSLLLFYYSGLMVVVNDDGAVRDKFYGLLFFVIVDFVVTLILASIFGSILYSQVKDLIGSLMEEDLSGTMLLSLF